MPKTWRGVSSALLVAGIVLVLLGFNSALEFTIAGVVASLAAVAALLYAGAVWFGPRLQLQPSSFAAPIVFDRAGLIVHGPAVGQPLASLFPDTAPAVIDRHMSAALAGITVRFACTYDGRSLFMDALPVRRADGVIVYGMLLAADTVPAGVAARA